MSTSNEQQCLHRTGRPLLAMALAAVLAVPGIVAAGPTIQVGDQGSLNISYSMQVWGQSRSYTSDTDNGSTFDTFLRRNRLTFAGQYNDYVGFYAQLEAGNDSKDGQDNRSVYYRDAYITLDRSDSMRFIVGRFKNTFSRENLEACLEPLTLDRAEIISYTPFGGSRDTGIAMWGNLDNAKLQYRVMIADGREGDVLPKHQPRTTARVHWSVFDPEPDYGYLGTYLGTKKVLTIGAAYDMQPQVAYANYTTRSNPQDYTGSTLDIFYEQPTASGTYTLSAATFDYDVGNAINTDPDPLLGSNTQLKATYVKGGYLFPNKIGKGRLQLFARHEDSKFNLTSGYLDQTSNAFGANYYLDGQKLKLTLEHNIVDFNTPNPSMASQQDYSKTTIGLQLIF